MSTTRRLDRAPLHEQIATILEKEIRERYRSGDKLPSESKLAERFKVSTLTVRQALAPLSDGGYIERVHGRGTFVADPVKRKHIAVLIDTEPETVRVADYFLTVARQVQHLLDHKGYHTRLFVGGWERPESDDEANLPPEFRRDVDKDSLLAVVGIASAGESRWMSLLRSDVPVVGDGRSMDHRVHAEYGEFIEKGLLHLKEKGCRRPAVLAWGIKSRKIRAIYKKCGLPWEAKRVVESEHPASFGAGYHAFCRLWDGLKKAPDGLLVADDLLMETALYSIIERQIRIPSDLKVVTHSNAGSMLFVPYPVDRLQQDPAVHAAALVDLVVGLIRGEGKAAHEIVVPFELIQS